MYYTSSQELSIYRSLAGQLQLGFFQEGERFPSVMEIATYFQVSYCPAQRALKALERDGLIKLCRGKETIVLARPHENYLESSTFQKRMSALKDLSKALELLSPSISLQGIGAMDKEDLSNHLAYEHQGKRLYHLFDQALRALGNQTVLNLYYDIGAFLESAFLDILAKEKSEIAYKTFLESITESIFDVIEDCKQSRHDAAKKKLNDLKSLFFHDITEYFNQLQIEPPCEEEQENFFWEPLKGRKKYCDLIAIDLVCKINEGRYPVGSQLPNKATLAKTYHVSEITIRRTIDLLNKSGITKTFNGIGTKVQSAGNLSVLDEFKDLMIDEHLKTFLESLQFLAFTSEAVLGYTLPYCSEKSLESLAHALENGAGNFSAVITIHSVCLQIIACECPIAAIREIYQKITILLLNGSILRFGDEQQISQGDIMFQKLSQSFNAGDYQRFAKAFSQMTSQTFTEMKERLKKAGIDEVDYIADLIVSER